MISKDIFTGEAIDFLLRKMEQINILQIDSQIQLSLLQLISSYSSIHFLECTILQSLYSILVLLLNSENETVVSLATSVVIERIQFFIEYSEKDANNMDESAKRHLELSFSTLSNLKFNHPFDKFLFSYIYDLIEISKGQKPKWLRVNESIHRFSFYYIFETIFFSHADYFSSSQNFPLLVNELINLTNLDDTPISFVVKLFVVYIEKVSQFPITILDQYVQPLIQKSPNPHHQLNTLRSIFLSEPNVLINFYLYCDLGADLIFNLFTSLRNYSEGAQISSQILLSLSPQTPNNDIDLQLSVPVELSVAFLRSCYLSQDSRTKPLFSKLFPLLMMIVNKGMICSLAESFFLIAQCFHYLIRLTDEMQLYDDREIAISSFCGLFSLTNDQESLLIAFNTLTTAIENSPCTLR